MKYTIYKITNKVNGKIYVGKHQTKDPNDNYMGSGKLLRRAQTKYGIENFTKEILYVFDTEEHMNAKERELVTEEFCLREDTYNICVGGQGGFSYINANGLGGTLGMKQNENTKKLKSIKNKQFWANMSNEDKLIHANKRRAAILQRPDKGMLISPFQAGNNPMFREDIRIKHKQSMQGKSIGTNNSQYGTVWITNGHVNKKIKNVDCIPEGWYKGRTLKV